MIQISSSKPGEVCRLWEGMKGERAWTQPGSGSDALRQARAAPSALGICGCHGSRGVGAGEQWPRREDS